MTNEIPVDLGVCRPTCLKNIIRGYGARRRNQVRDIEARGEAKVDQIFTCNEMTNDAHRMSSFE